MNITIKMIYNMIGRIVLSVFAMLFFYNSYGQQKTFNYDSEWKKIEKLVSEQGLPETALSELQKIYARAVADKNEPQRIKVLLYKAAIRQREEDATLKTISELEKETSKSSGAAKAILRSITAEAYNSYYQRMRWQIDGRTSVSNVDTSASIETWTSSQFQNKIRTLFLSSLSDEKTLQSTKIASYDPVIIRGNARQLRPTLFDLLAHRALEYFQYHYQTGGRSLEQFRIDNAVYFSPARNFISFRLQAIDSASNHYNALRIYQSLIAFHQQQSNTRALLDVDLLRIAFVYQNAVLENKKDLYTEALHQLIKTYPKFIEPAVLLAQLHMESGNSFAPQDTASKDGYIKAKTILDAAIQRADTTEKKSAALALLNEIKQAELSMTAELVNTPGLPFRVLVSYRNTPQLFGRIIKVNRKTREELGNNWEKSYWTNLLKLPVYRTFNQTLPGTGDYMMHRAEMKVDSLPVGEYAVLMSSSKSFDNDSAPLSVNFIHVSSIAFLNRDNNFFVVNRESGQPLKEATVQVWDRTYNSNSSRYILTRANTFKTDDRGFFTYLEPRLLRNRQSYFEFSHQGDYLFLNEEHEAFSSSTQYLQPDTTTEGESFTRKNSRAFLFTDRSIYRPGQEIFFKGIITSKNYRSGNAVILPNRKHRVYLADANETIVDSMEVTTNSFGSYTGKFIIPAGLLTGSFHLRDSYTDDRSYFSVEEYKRPKFIAELKPVEKTYRLNDSIVIAGSARSFDGSFTSNAQVRFRVVRRTMIPYPWFRKIWPPQSRETVEITNGSLTADASGNFKFSFKAEPDPKMKKEDRPIFYYEVSADITDIAGETRSTEISIPLSYQAIQVSVDLPEVVIYDSLKSFTLQTLNLQGEFVRSDVRINIRELDAPKRIFRSRLWEQPDQLLMSKEDFYKSFPNDIYSNEDQVENWPERSLVWEKTDSSHSSGVYNPQKLNLKGGHYKIEVSTTDQYGELTRAVDYFQVIENDATGGRAFGKIFASTTTAEPGSVVKLTVVSNLQNVQGVYQMQEKDSLRVPELINLQNYRRQNSLAIVEEQRGGVHVNFAFVKMNRIFSETISIDVPYTNRKLEIIYETYREKTLPGAKEKWKLKISGPNSEKAAAEILTAMYDASLDQFNPHQWQVPSLWQNSAPIAEWNGMTNFSLRRSFSIFPQQTQLAYDHKIYDRLMSENGERSIALRGRASGMVMKDAAAAAPNNEMAEFKTTNQSVAEANEEGLVDSVKDAASQTPPSIQIRKNLNETAFIFPQLLTDSSGGVEINFTIPEAMTTWKWMTLAHTKELGFGYSEKTIVTQKQLMVRPNAPRFLREGDRLDFSASISNLSGKELTGQVELQFIDPESNQSVDGWFRNMFPNQYFTVGAGESVPVSFTVEVPYEYVRPVIYRIIVKSDSLGDGEEAYLPVISNRILITESIPLPIRGSDKKQFKFEKLVSSADSETLTHHRLSVEFTANPAWYAVQSLPYLKEKNCECTDQIFNRFYANALAFKIAGSFPQLASLAKEWSKDSSKFLSNLQKNPELKTIILQETPWVLEGKNEEEQRRNLALLFDVVQMKTEIQNALDQLQAMQTEEGGFSWMKGGPENQYTTQHILAGIGHLIKLDAIAPATQAQLNVIATKALAYLDRKIAVAYDRQRNARPKPVIPGLGAIEIHYLYMRSFFTGNAIPGKTFAAYNHYRKLSQSEWLKQSKYLQGMIALSLNRTGDPQTAKKILASLKQFAIKDPELGMYWKDNTGGYYWQQAPIETQSLLIESFSEINNDRESVDAMKTWLLKNKQTNGWKTSKATADAVYALLLQGTDWLTSTPQVQVRLGDLTFPSVVTKLDSLSGYFKESVEGNRVKPEMGNIEVYVKSANQSTTQRPAWGAVYWQYFENLENIKFSKTPLQLKKELYLKRNTATGPTLTRVRDNEILKVGDRITVRIELKADREMEYIHLKDMRASAMEPLNVLSGYKWKSGLGYYEATRDASTSFFFDRITRGTYVFEYEMFVTHSGTFNNGVATIESMYAPEFRSNSESLRLNIEQ